MLCRKLSLSRKLPCQKCNGAGSKSGKRHTCSTCQGSGVTVIIRPIGVGMMQQIQAKCSDCFGSGYSSPPSKHGLLVGSCGHVVAKSTMTDACKRLRVLLSVMLTWRCHTLYWHWCEKENQLIPLGVTRTGHQQACFSAPLTTTIKCCCRQRSVPDADLACIRCGASLVQRSDDCATGRCNSLHILSAFHFSCYAPAHTGTHQAAVSISPVPLGDRCSGCSGACLVSEKKTFEVAVEAGMKSNQRITLRGEAGCTEPGLQPGDVVLVLQQKEHDIFTRLPNPADLVMEKRITLGDALCGCR